MRALLPAIVLSLAAPVWAETLVIDGEVPDGPEPIFLVPFQVPDGIAEIEVRHDDLSSANVLDWGLEDPQGVRGWGGGNEEPAVVGVRAASRSFRPGPMPAGTWNVIVGKALIAKKPARYHLELELRAAATLADQPERQPYRHAAALEAGPRWYAGDFHVHSRESGDARPTLDEIASLAKARGLDFVALSDHNTSSQLDFIVDAQSRHPGVLLVPSVEVTTYSGHGNAFGATGPIDYRMAYSDDGLPRALEALSTMGAVFTLNHPTLDLAGNCLGCSWRLRVPVRGVGAVEIGTGGWDTTGALFSLPAVAFWDRLSDQGLHLSAVGGSDDHRAGVNLNQTQSPIGDPTTLVFARELSVTALAEGVRSGRTVVKLRGPGDPMVALEASGERKGDTVVGESSHLTVTVTNGLGAAVRLVRNGRPEEAVAVDADPFVLERDVTAPQTSEDRYRAEVLVAGLPRTITSHVYLSRTFPAEGPRAPLAAGAPEGCTCAASPGLLLVLPLAAYLARRRRR